MENLEAENYRKTYQVLDARWASLRRWCLGLLIGMGVVAVSTPVLAIVISPWYNLLYVLYCIALFLFIWCTLNIKKIKKKRSKLLVAHYARKKEATKADG